MLRRQGNELFRKGRYRDAIAAYTASIAIRSDDPLVLANRAAAYMMEEDYYRAVRRAMAWQALDCAHTLPPVVDHCIAVGLAPPPPADRGL